MLVVQIDVIGRQPSQRTVHGDTDIRGAAVESRTAGVRDQAELGGQHHLIPPAPQGASQKFFVDIGAVNLGRVDQGDTQVDGAMNGANRFGVVAAGAGVGHRHTHRPQPEAADLQIGEMSLLHRPIVRPANSRSGTGTVARVHRIDVPTMR